jgi:Glycosyl transferase family 2
MKFAYICTNYNNTHFSRAAVESLMNTDSLPAQIVIVDNASRPDEVAALEAVARDYPLVDLVLNETNIGYFRGLNVGIAHGRKTRPDIGHLVIGNNDLSFPHDFGSRLSTALPALQHCPVISPNMITLDDLHQNPHVITGLSRIRELIYDLYFASPLLARLIRIAAAKTKGLTDRADEEQHATGQYIYQGHGSCYVLTPRFFELFDELWAPTFLACRSITSPASLSAIIAMARFKTCRQNGCGNLAATRTEFIGATSNHGTNRGSRSAARRNDHQTRIPNLLALRDGHQRFPDRVRY